MSLRQKLNDAMKEAMKAKDAKRLATVRLILAALKDRDIAARSETNKDLVSDDGILTLLAKMIKQREESATAFDAGNRPEMAAGEREEIAVIRTFMPAQMDEAAMKDASLNPGHGWVSHLCAEPKIIHGVMLNDLAPHVTAGRVTIQMIDSPPVFKSTTQNGIKSDIWTTATSAAFQFAPATKP